MRWELRPVPTVEAVEGTRVVVPVSQDGVEVVKRDDLGETPEEGEETAEVISRGDKLFPDPFRLTIPGLEVPPYEPRERLSLDDIRTLRLRNEHEHMKEGIRLEEESLRKLKEEREAFEKSFLAKRSGNIGEHAAQIKHLEQISVNVGLLEGTEVRLKSETEKLVVRNKEISSEILARQLQVAEYDELLKKQDSKLGRVGSASSTS